MAQTTRSVGDGIPTRSVGTSDNVTLRINILVPTLRVGMPSPTLRVSSVVRPRRVAGANVFVPRWEASDDATARPRRGTGARRLGPGHPNHGFPGIFARL